MSQRYVDVLDYFVKVGNLVEVSFLDFYEDWETDGPCERLEQVYTWLKDHGLDAVGYDGGDELFLRPLDFCDVDFNRMAVIFFDCMSCYAKPGEVMAEFKQKFGDKVTA